MESKAEISKQDSGPKKTAFDDLNREELITKCKSLLAIAQKAKLAKNDLQNELDNHKVLLEKCVKEKKTSLENAYTLQELVDSLTEQKLNFITEVDSAQGRIKTLNSKCNKHEEEINKYKGDLTLREKHITEITQKLSDLDTKVISLERQNNHLLDENEQLLNQLSEIEARTNEVNNIGLQQMEQLRILEENVQTDNKSIIEELNNKIKELENKLQTTQENEQKIINYESKIEEVNQLYETEKAKKEKLNIKLKSYKDKILKCAACINQLKNSRYILTKTVTDYSENIPKWQSDIIKASKVLDDQINELNNENKSLKEKIQGLEIQLTELQTSQKKVHSEIEKSQLDSNHEIDSLKSEICKLQEQINEHSSNKVKLNDQLTKLKHKYQQLNELQLPAQENENKLLKDQLNDQLQKNKDLSQRNTELIKVVNDLEAKNQNIEAIMQNKTGNDATENLILQIKSLESEKSTLVKEKLNARDCVVELESHNKILTDQISKLRLETQSIKNRMEMTAQEKLVKESNYKKEKDGEINKLKCKIMGLQDKCDLLKKEHDDMQDLNGLLKEEVETLKLSLEQPKDDNLSDLNVSLQADIVKLETKLAAYKQENSCLLAEVKESRNKVKEFDSMVVEYEDAKSKLAGYKTENTELLNEMKEINQVLKERGEAISKLEKAIAEMERLVETLEKDRDSVKQDKEDLLKRTEKFECDLKKAKQETNKNKKNTDQIILEKENAEKLLSEKNAIIANMKDEIEKLKQHNSSSAELPNEDMSTSTISKAEENARMKDLDETFEEKYTKLRIFALKLKKKLNETTKQLQNTEQDKAKLEKMLNENGAVNNKHVPPAANEKVETVADIINKPEITMLEAKVKSLTNDVENSQQIVAELEEIKAELESKSLQLASEIEAHKVTKDNLEKARRDVKKKSVLSLEMEDYERSMKELTTKMEEKKRKMVQLESTIDTQEGTLTAMKTQIKLLEEQIKTEETQNRLVKEELQHTLEEGKEKDNVILIKNEIITKLEQDLEDEKRKNEETDLETTSLLSEKEKIIMCLGEDKAELNNKVKRLEFKCGELNERLRIVNIELADLKTEYTSYKVRAQAVLRQNQTVDHSQEEQLKEEAAALKAQIENLTAKLATAEELCSDQTLEVENARRRAAEATAEATRAQQRTARLHSDLTRLSQQMESERTQQKLQVSTLTQCYKSQITELESKLQEETKVLTKLLALAKRGVNYDKLGETSDAQNNPYMLPVIPKDDGSDGEMDINVSMIPREEGEGSEAAPSPPPSKTFMSSGGSGRSPVPLERLLEEGVPDDEALDASSLALTTEQEIADLKRRLQAQQQRVKHVTVLLSESERECARMAQLSELLKGELRRVRGAALQPHNTEYMKNVTLKFLTLPPGDERSRLVPVLQKILTLTSDETQKIQAIAKGMDPNSRGWGSYLPWPGGK